ncbi:hypothetical protein [Rubrivirga sp. IMCC45206]|uniref:hypothetical protein n=1 Tax=Rubrivirga sp. IMCC45206 TaxID=3391614 RepID=UPI0039900D23
MARPIPATRPARALRAALVGFVVVGYGLALGATAPGQGLAILPHLLLDHHGHALVAPTLVDEPRADTVIPTLRPESHAHDARHHTHRQGGEAHTHDGVPETAPRETWRTLRATAPPSAAGWHAHGDDVHRHISSEPDAGPEAVIAVALDDHRPAMAPALPPAAATPADLGAPTTTMVSHQMSVETPPPIGQG